MSRPIHTRGLVLRRTDWSETSQIVTVDTRDHGIVDLLAKGSRRPARRSSSFAEPLDLGGWYDLVYRPRKGDLHLAVEARLIEGFPHLRDDLGAWLEANGILDLLRASFSPGDPHPALLRSALSCLKLLSVGRARLALRDRFVIELLDRSGVWSVGDTCANCEAEIPRGAAHWHAPAALLCAGCRTGGDRPVPEELRTLLGTLQSTAWGNIPSLVAPEPLLAAIWERLREALLHHLERAPRSLRYLRAGGPPGTGAPLRSPSPR